MISLHAFEAKSPFWTAKWLILGENWSNGQLDDRNDIRRPPQPQTHGHKHLKNHISEYPEKHPHSIIKYTPNCCVLLTTLNSPPRPTPFGKKNRAHLFTCYYWKAPTKHRSTPVSRSWQMFLVCTKRVVGDSEWWWCVMKRRQQVRSCNVPALVYHPLSVFQHDGRAILTMLSKVFFSKSLT